jgi:protein-disulfide isomerase
MTILRSVLFSFLCVAWCSAQGGWETATALPNVDLTGLTAAQRITALAAMRAEKCACGCGMKIAQCRINDPSCANSRRLAYLVVREASAGKKLADIRAELVKIANTAPPILDDQPTRISTDGDPARGPANARVTIVEFSDFQCPYCAAAANEVAKILKQYPADVRLIFKQFPLDMHSQAHVAAEAALAAQAQGRFWELHDRLYAHFREINRTRILAWAGEIGLDLNRFQSDLDSHKFNARVNAEEQEGEKAEVEGTPTFFINGRRLNASFDVATVAPLIADALKHN